MSPTTEAADLSTVVAGHFRDFGFSSDVRYLYGQVLTVYRHLDHRRGEVEALWGLGEFERRVGEYGQARQSEADALWELGNVASDIAEPRHAREHWQTALVIYEELGVPFAETVRAAMCQLTC